MEANRFTPLCCTRLQAPISAGHVTLGRMGARFESQRFAMYCATVGSRSAQTLVIACLCPCSLHGSLQSANGRPAQRILYKEYCKDQDVQYHCTQRKYVEVGDGTSWAHASCTPTSAGRVLHSHSAAVAARRARPRARLLAAGEAACALCHGAGSGAAAAGGNVGTSTGGVRGGGSDGGRGGSHPPAVKGPATGARATPGTAAGNSRQGSLPLAAGRGAPPRAPPSTAKAITRDGAAALGSPVPRQRRHPRGILPLGGCTLPPTHRLLPSRKIPSPLPPLRRLPQRHSRRRGRKLRSRAASQPPGRPSGPTC